MPNTFEDDHHFVKVGEEIGLQQCQLLKMPVKAWDAMLEHLGGKELLSLRRVCKTTKNLIFKYTPSAMQEFLLEIQPGSNGSKTFDAVVRSGLPVTNIFINNGNSGYGGMDIYTSPGIPEFTNTYGGRIRTLKVQNFSTFICSAEFKFFESLVNLKELSIEVMDARNRPTGNSIQHQFPANFENLKVLKFGQILDPSKRPFKTRFQWDLIDACPRLEYLVLPLTERELEEGLDTADDPWFFMMVVDYLNNQRANGIPPLKTLDLAHFAGRHFGTASFAPFMDSISGLANKGLPFPDIQLKNLHAEHLQYYAFDIHRRRMQEHIFENRHIISLIDVVPRLQGLNLPNLETIRISSSMRLLEIVCHLDIRKMAHKLPFPVPDGIFNDWVRPVIGSGLPDWPMLKTLFIVFDGIKGDPKKFKWIFDFVFKVKERKSVENLSLVFTPQVASIPSLAQIVTCKTLARNFGNVKVLEIFGWQVNNTGYVHLWEGLGQLEELTIGYCPNFGGSALFGKNPDEPTFLKLKHLRILRLSGMDKMPLVTDRAFINIFSKMCLRELHLQADHALGKVSQIGILSLLDGEFGRSVEKFPFHGWSLQGYSKAKFQMLGKKFRSIL